MMPFFFDKWKQAQNWMKFTAFPAIQNTLFKNDVLKIPTYKILCIDDDRSFCLFIQRLARSLGIQVELAYSCVEAKQAIQIYSNYQAFIIDGHLPDGSGFELVAWIREKKELTTPIGFISRIYQDAGSFRILKDSLKVDYVLEKPIKPSEIHQLLIQLCHLKTRSIDPKPFSDNLLTDLKVTYQKTIPDKVERLEKKILAIQKNPTIENLQALRLEVHKIAGSAGSYGYIAVSEICKNLEMDLIKQIEWVKKEQLDPQWLFSLDDFYTQIKLHFQMEFSKKDSLETITSRGHLPSIYVIDKDETLLKTLISANQDLQFDVLIESRPDQALQKLLSIDFYPQILLINAHYSSAFLTGYDLLKAFYQRNDYLTTIVALIVEAEALEEQVEAFERGMTFISTKPFFPALLLPFLDQIPFRSLPLHYKILVVDEDEDICQYILKTLKYIGLEIKVLQNFRELELVLNHYQPDLILLDIHLIDESGRGILDWIRNILRYNKLLVGMLTVTQQDMYLIQKCYEFNVDEILFKPLEGTVLQRKIAYLFKKQAKQELIATEDKVTGLDNAQTLKRYLHELQQQFQIPFPKILFIFELEKFMSIHQKLKKEVIAFISQHLEELLKKYEMVAYLGQGRFALIFQGYDPHFVQLFMLFFLSRLQLKLRKIFVEDFYPSMRASLVLLSKEEKAEDILRRGKRLLRFAKQQQIPLMVDPFFVAAKEVLVFHEESQSVQAFKILFETQGFKVNFYLKWEEELFSSLTPFPLFILTESFIASKGLYLLKKLFKENQMQIPILHLSHGFKIEFLQRLLNRINYFEAPFGLLILIEGTSEGKTTIDH